MNVSKLPGTLPTRLVMSAGVPTKPHDQTALHFIEDVVCSYFDERIADQTDHAAEGRNADADRSANHGDADPNHADAKAENAPAVTAVDRREFLFR